MNKLFSLSEAIQRIQSGARLILSGHESLLRQLPKGNWIGATISRFLDISGGLISDDKVFIVDLSEYVIDFRIRTYDEITIHHFLDDSYENGFSYVLIPQFSKVHAEYGMTAMNMKELFKNPVVGWIAGINPVDEGKLIPQVFDGFTGTVLDKSAVVMHCRLNQNKIARIEIVNPFVQGEGDEFEFLEPSFMVRHCLINGRLRNLSDYMIKNHIDERLPFIADMSGASINVHPLVIDCNSGTVTMAAAVLPGYKYKLARVFNDYVGSFKSRIPTDTQDIISTINCHANFEFLKLEGHKLGSLTGPFALGEIGYILLNQTTINLYIDDSNFL